MDKLFFSFKLSLPRYSISTAIFLNANKTKLPFFNFQIVENSQCGENVENKWTFSYIVDRNVNCDKLFGKYLVNVYEYLWT